MEFPKLRNIILRKTRAAKFARKCIPGQHHPETALVQIFDETGNYQPNIKGTSA